jgi:hypothetical protein
MAELSSESSAYNRSMESGSLTNNTYFLDDIDKEEVNVTVVDQNYGSQLLEFIIDDETQPDEIETDGDWSDVKVAEYGDLDADLPGETNKGLSANGKSPCIQPGSTTPVNANETAKETTGEDKSGGGTDTGGGGGSGGSVIQEGVKGEVKVETTNFVPSTNTGNEPQQNTGKKIGDVIKLKGNLWYQEIEMFAVAFGSVSNLTPFVPKSQGIERVKSYTNNGDGVARIELGTSGYGGTQYKFPKQDWGPRWINFSYFEEPAMGWASGQPTGAFIINGKNYGAKTASRMYVPVLYWLKGDSHPKLAKSKEIFVAKKASPPHAQNPQSQASFINNITIAVPGAATVVQGNTVKGSEGGAFVGKTKDGSGNIKYFVGLKTGGAASTMIAEMNSKGKQIEWMVTADPGGSYQFHSDGEKHPANTNRGIPVGLKW